MPTDPQSLRTRIATAAGKGTYVRSLFATIADRYDFITRVLSFGADRRWKQRLVGLSRVDRHGDVLDLATGTGDIALEAASRAGRVVGIDITPRMIELARRKAPASMAVRFLVGDMMALPFAASSFDLVTTGYGLRNVPGLEGAIREIARVLRPGGELLSLDFNRPSNGFVRRVYLAYLWIVGGALGWLLHRDPDTYRYIPESIRLYPGAAQVAIMIRDAGFSKVTCHPVLGGLMAIHHAIK